MLNFSHIIGNDKVKKYLTHMLENDRVGQSLLFAGPDSSGKELFAEVLAKALIGTDREEHPDLHVYRPEGKIAMHSIETMRRFSDEVYSYPTEAKKQVFIIHDADRMLPTSANALLKTFEEPSSQSVIILLSSNPGALMPTVLSRCRRVYFEPVNGAAEKVEDDKSRILLELLARGGVSTYKELSQQITTISDQFEASREELETALRQELAPVHADELNAVQKEALQKEVDGAVTLRIREEIDKLLGVVLGWYRDMQVLYVRGDKRLLMHPDYANAIDQALQRGLMIPLERVEEAVSAAKLAIERSSSLRPTLEALFLKLNYL